MLLYLEEFLDHSRLLISGRNKTYIDEQEDGSVSLLGATAPFLASAVRNPLSSFHRPQELPGAGPWELAAQHQQLSVLSGRVCEGFLNKVRISIGRYHELLLTE